MWKQGSVALVVLCACTGATGTKTGETGAHVTEQQIIDTWQQWVEQHDDCTLDEDCTAISPGCPLGCLTAVSTVHRQAAIDESNALIDACDCPCDYSCTPGGPAVCDDGTCVILVPATP